MGPCHPGETGLSAMLHPDLAWSQPLQAFEGWQCWEFAVKDNSKIISGLTGKKNFHEDNFTVQSKADLRERGLLS